MSRRQDSGSPATGRREFLHAGAVGAFAIALAGVGTREGQAADVQYNKADMALVNKKLRTSARERKAFYADPKAYLKANGVRLPDHMIPNQAEIEEGLAAKPGTVIGGGKVSAITLMHMIQVGDPNIAPAIKARPMQRPAP